MPPLFCLEDRAGDGRGSATCPGGVSRAGLCYACCVTRPLILVSNDDGVSARGIEVLAKTAAAYGDVIVCAPAGEQSAMSHAITLHANLRVREVREGWFAITGTPVDSVYLGALHICPRPPDIVLAGINDGYNLGTDVFYSGTVGAAREGRLRGASAAAFSVKSRTDHEVILPAVHAVVPRLIERHERGERHLINVNAPEPPTPGEPMAMEVVRLGRRRYQDKVERREDLMGRPYYWLGGPPSPSDDEDDGDIRVAHAGKISITPIELDITAPELDQWAGWMEDES